LPSGTAVRKPIRNYLGPRTFWDTDMASKALFIIALGFALGYATKWQCEEETKHRAAMHEALKPVDCLLGAPRVVVVSAKP
jgi:hypothetical protein